MHLDGNRLGGDFSESLNFWYHLGKANLAADGFRGYTGSVPTTWEGESPHFKINNTSYVNAYSLTSVGNGDTGTCNFYGQDFGNVFFISAVHTSGCPAGTVCFGNSMTAFDAYSIDSKIDDGLPRSGQVRAGVEYSGPMIAASGSTDASGCADYTTNTYDVLGVWNGGAYEVGGLKPNRVDCILVVGKAF